MIATPIDLSPISEADLDDHWFTLLLRVWRDVRSAVKATGVEQQALAARIGMNPGQFSKVLTGKKANITLRTLHNIARAAGYRLRVSLEPLSQLRTPNCTYEAAKKERDLFIRTIRETTEDVSLLRGWNSAESNLHPKSLVSVTTGS